jgi:antitoxin Phd
MARMSISKAREKMAEVIELAATEAVILERHGKPTAVVISYERYDELMDALETLEDLAALEEYHAEQEANPEPPIPLEELARELGL